MKQIDYSKLYTLRADGRYTGSYKGKDGKRHFVYDRDPKQLHEKLQKITETPVVTFRDVADKWEAGYRQTVTERTWANLRPHVADILASYGDRPVEEIAAADVIQDLARAKALGYSRTVVNERKVIWTGILNQALVDRQIAVNPAVSVSLPKGLKAGKRSSPSDDVIRTVIQHREDPFGFFPFLLLCTGLRKAEALALLVSDIDLKGRTISITKALTYPTGSPVVKSTKTGRDRVVPITDMLYQPLADHLASISGPEVFPQQKSNRAAGGGYMGERAYEGAWTRWCVCAGLTDEEGKCTLTAHSLRHATATLLYESGADVYTAQKILGHSRVSTTLDIYTDLRDQQRVTSTKAFNDRLNQIVVDSVVKNR